MQLNDALDVKKVYYGYKSWKIPGTPWEICGYSRAAYRTGFYISALDLLLDAGPQHFARPSTIMITHTHGDHIANLPFTLIGFDETKERTNMAVQVCGPAEAKFHMEEYIDVLFTTNAMTDPSPREELDKYYKYNGFKPGEIVEMILHKEKITVEIFACDHRIPTISYGFTEVKKKLLSEYLTKTGKEIAALRKEGVEVMHNVPFKRFAYVCDTTINVFTMNPTLLEYPVIFIECTFIKPDEVEMASGKDHIHWNDLEPIVVLNPHITFMLFHFSQRYKDAEIVEFFDKIIVDKKINNLHYWAK